ncbi:SCO family protein [Maricaulaceae bacterium MS644]
MSNRPVWLFPAIALGAAVILGGALAAAVVSRSGDAGPRSGAVRVSGEAQIGGPFTLVNQDGETVTNETYRGKAMLIYFGFTYCPDVCPLSLQVMDAALARLDEDQRAAFQPILITVDPERDTPQALADYVRADAFPEGLVGLTGSAEQVREAARAYRVFYARIEDDGVSSAYTVDHSSLIFLMDQDGAFADVFPHGTSPDQLASRLQQFLEENPAQS